MKLYYIIGTYSSTISETQYKIEFTELRLTYNIPANPALLVYSNGWKIKITNNVLDC